MTPGHRTVCGMPGGDAAILSASVNLLCFLYFRPLDQDRNPETPTSSAAPTRFLLMRLPYITNLHEYGYYVANMYLYKYMLSDCHIYKNIYKHYLNLFKFIK